MSGVEFIVGDWIQNADPDPRSASTSAELTVVVDGISATRLFDTWSRTVSDRARLPIYPLAEWFAANWWRLHAEAPYEGGGFPATDWRMSHDLTAIGGGYVWPRMRFAFDDWAVQISARAVQNAPWEPVRHLNDIQPARSVPLAIFDRAVGDLIDLVLRRLADVGVSAEPLATIWSDVRAERLDPEVSEWRRWEARLGYDPEQVPDALMDRLAGLFGRAGKPAAAEVAPLLSTNYDVMLGRLEALAAAPGIAAALPIGEAFEVDLGVAPWDAGRELARRVRGDAGFVEGPIANADLADLLGCSVAAFDEIPGWDVPIGLGVKSDGGATLHFRKRNMPGFRFEAARFLADGIFASREDRWLPLTDRGTARQKFQRSFAAELLAPIAEVGSEFDLDSTPERIEDLSDVYGVSPLAIRSHLANHGYLNPEAVALVG